MKINLILSILALILAIPCWVTITAEAVEDFVDSSDIPMMFPGFSADPVQIIEIRKRKDEDLIKAQNIPEDQQFDVMAFQRSADGWVLVTGAKRGLKVDAALIESNILDHVLDLRLDPDGMVPEDQVTPEFRMSHELTPETGITIRCFGQPAQQGAQPPELAILVRGKTTKRSGGGRESISGYYVVNPNRPRDVVIYEPASEDWHLPLDESQWADKLVHEFLVGEVDTFYVKNALGSVGFKRSREGNWQPIAEQCKAAGKPIDLKKYKHVKKDDVNQLLEHFKKVEAESFARQKIPADAGGTEVHVRAILKDGQEFSMYVSGNRDQAAQNFDAVATNHDFKFQISGFSVGGYQKMDPADMFHQ